MSEKESLYHYIKKNMVGDQLPKEFSLPKDTPKNQIIFADGAEDGIAIYHMGNSDVSEESIELLSEWRKAVSDGDFELGHRKLEEFAKSNTPLNAIDEFEGNIIHHASELNAENIHGFAMKCIMESSSVDIVKYALEILEVFSEPDEELKDIIRTFGMSDEFTLFSIFNMLSWENANEEIFSLAKKVRGWGRVHAVARLEPETEEIRRWLLEEGIDNKVIPAYSALEVYHKADVCGLLKSELTENELCQVGDILSALLDEGPTVGISAVEAADVMITDFLKQVQRSKPVLSLCETVLELSKETGSEEVSALCKEILSSAAVKEAVLLWAKDAEGLELAEYLEIDYFEPLYNCIVDDFDKHFYKCDRLIKNDFFREKVFQLFREHMPMKQMVSEPQDCLGLGKEYENYSRLGYLVQHLTEYPLCGTDFVELALKSPVVSNRNMALRVLDSWCKKKQCTLQELSSELFSNVEELKKKEVSENVLKNIAQYGF